MYTIQAYKTEYVSWRTGVSPRPVTKWRIIREADGRVIETGIKTKKDAEWILRGISK